MIDCGSLEYTQARVQARHGRRVGVAVWASLQSTRDFGALLAAVRGTSLRPWAAGLTAESGVRQIETALRAQWRSTVAEVGGWMPREWQPALAWCSIVPDLPALQHLARGGAARDWMRDDSRWRALAEADRGARRQVLEAGSLKPLAAAWNEPQALGQAWLAEWWRRAPNARQAAEPNLRRLGAALLAHHAAFAAAPPGSGEWLRAELRSRLVLLLRRAALQPAVAFIHLALCALDLERLRGELLRRALCAGAKVA